MPATLSIEKSLSSHSGRRVQNGVLAQCSGDDCLSRVAVVARGWCVIPYPCLDGVGVSVNVGNAKRCYLECRYSCHAIVTVHERCLYSIDHSGSGGSAFKI